MSSIPDLSPESPQGDVRNALALLRFAKARATELTIPPDAELLELLRAAEGRCWRAVNALEAPTPVPPWWRFVHRLARKRGWLTRTR